jgi:tryptophanyl-tRNA synthetase
MSSTLLLPGEELPLTDGREIRARLEHQLDAVLDGGQLRHRAHHGGRSGRVNPPVILRQGRGHTAWIYAGPPYNAFLQPLQTAASPAGIMPADECCSARQARALRHAPHRPALHLGNYHGALRNWVELQYQYECYFFVADWHALTTGYDNTAGLQEAIHEMVIDWLAAGLNPGVATLFVQSQVPEHAELHLLLSMITPLGWLERVPSYKDQQEQLRKRTWRPTGSWAIRCCRAPTSCSTGPRSCRWARTRWRTWRFTREVARRFNILYGREPDFEQKAERAVKELGGRNITLYRQLRKQFQEKGRYERAGTRARRWWRQHAHHGRRPRAAARLPRGHQVSILPEPQALLTASPKVPGLDGRKMSKSYGNTIGLREDPDAWRASSRPCRPIRRACGAPIRAIRKNARCSTCIASIRTRPREPGPAPAAAAPASAAWSARSR